MDTVTRSACFLQWNWFSSFGTIHTTTMTSLPCSRLPWSSSSAFWWQPSSPLHPHGATTVPSHPSGSHQVVWSPSSWSHPPVLCMVQWRLKKCFDRMMKALKQRGMLVRQWQTVQPASIIPHTQRPPLPCSSHTQRTPFHAHIYWPLQYWSTGSQWLAVHSMQTIFCWLAFNRCFC